MTKDEERFDATTHPKVGFERVQKTLGDLESREIGVVPSRDTLSGVDGVASLDGRKGSENALMKKEEKPSVEPRRRGRKKGEKRRTDFEGFFPRAERASLDQGRGVRGVC